MNALLLRHGQSDWNAQNRFTGFVDVDLTEAGEAEARQGRPALAGLAGGGPGASPGRRPTAYLDWRLAAMRGPVRESVTG